MKSEKLKIYYLAATHWDREWYQTFQGFRYRLVNTMNEIMEGLENDPEFKVFYFDGQTVILEDFLEIEPDKKERLARLVKDKRVVIGPWYVMPDEFLLSGESLVRNLMLGHRIAREWGAEPWKYGYICDMFGHIAQMPQILNGFGIRYALLGRGTNEHTTLAHFVWKSPDGSECITFKLQDNGGYGSFFSDVLNGNTIKAGVTDEFKQKLKNHIESEKNRSGVPILILMDGLDHETIHTEAPLCLSVIKELYPDAEVYWLDVDNMGSELDKHKGRMPVKAGELNETAKKNVNYLHLLTHTLSSRYPIKKANDECQTILEKWLEPLAAIYAFKGFPILKSYVDLAYKYLLQNHAHDSICGCAIDQVHKDMEYRFDQCKAISAQLFEEMFNFERTQYKYEDDSQTMVLQLWNPLPFARKEVVTVDIDFDRDYRTRYQEPFGYECKNSFKILDGNGREIPYGLVNIKRNYTKRRYKQFVEWVDVHTVTFEAELAAMGATEYKVVSCNEPSRYLDIMSRNEHEAENEYIKLSINNNGTINIYDKISKKLYDNLLNYIDDGELGDGWYHVNPTEDRIITSEGSDCRIEKVENGPSRTVFKVVRTLKVPERMEYWQQNIRRSEIYTTLRIVSLIGISKGSNHIDVDTTITNTARDHRLRLKIPTGVKASTFFADQPFAFVERKTGIKLETQDWNECDVPEKQMSGIVGKRDRDGTGLAFISAYGLHECSAPDDEYGSIYVTLFRSFGKTFMTNGEDGAQIIGDHNFKYRLVPLRPEISYASLIRLKDCLQTGIKYNTFRVSADYVLPSPTSYFELEDGNICMSILKRAEKNEKDVIIIRLYNMSDESSNTEIKCFKELIGAAEVNLNEEYLRSVPFTGNVAKIILSPWKVMTLELHF